MIAKDDEMMEIIKDLEAAGKKVNKTTAKKKGDLTAGETSFVENDSPFDEQEETPVSISDDKDDVLVKAAKAEEGGKIVLETKANLIRKYALATHSIYTEGKGTPQEKTFGTKSLWNYIIALNGCHIRVINQWEELTGDVASGVEKNVYCKAQLVKTESEKVISTVIMVASTDEQWVSCNRNKLSVAYGLAQTRAEERLARGVFGYQAALAGLDITPAEELDVQVDLWGVKDIEL